MIDNPNPTEPGSSQHPEIPANWNFVGRGNNIGEGADVVQLVKDQGFIALKQKTDEIDIEEKPGLPIDYPEEFIFNNEGRVKAYRRSSLYGGWILIEGEPKVSCLLNLRNPLRIPEVDRYFKIEFLQDQVGSSPSIFDNLGSASYSSEGNLSDVDLGGFSDRSGETWGSLFSLSLAKNGLSEASEDWEEKETKRPEKQEVSGEEFVTSWSLEQGKMLITQTQLSTGIIKKFSAPLRIDRKTIENTYAANAPYPEHKVGGETMVDIPWMRVPGLIGAKLSYSGLKMPGKDTSVTL